MSRRLHLVMVAAASKEVLNRGVPVYISSWAKHGIEIVSLDTCCRAPSLNHVRIDNVAEEMELLTSTDGRQLTSVDLVAHLPDGAFHEFGDVRRGKQGGYSFRIASRVCSRASARSMGLSAIGRNPTRYVVEETIQAIVSENDGR